jgi:hypothetical protein
MLLIITVACSIVLKGVHCLNVGWDNGYYDKLFVVFPQFSNANTGKVPRVGHDYSFPNYISPKFQ